MSKRAIGTAAWKRTRLKVLSRDGYTCAYCGQAADSVDHIVARSKGGDMFDLDNLVACCRLCNSRKESKEMSVFLGRVSTPPALSDVSLSKTVTRVPLSPFSPPIEE